MPFQFRIEVKYLLAGLVWVIYAVISVVTLLTHQPSEIVRQVLGVGAVVALLATFFVTCPE